MKRLRLAGAALVLLAAALALSPFPRAFTETESASSFAQQSQRAGQQTTPSTTLRMDDQATSTKIIKMVRPVYPHTAEQAHVEGTVALHVITNKDGSVKKVSFVSGPPLLMQAAIDAVRQWRFQPTLVNGKPVTDHTVVRVVFSLKHAGDAR